MNLNKLFKTQAELDKKIVEEKGLQGQDLLDKKILALQVELGELANEHRGFKFWSEDREPRTGILIECEKCGGSGRDYYGYCGNCHGGYVGKTNPLLEEYVDCLHFILSIGNDLEFVVSNTEVMRQESITDALLDLFELVSTLSWNIDSDNYSVLLARFIELGEKLGFTWEQVVDAYYKKNEINHERQENGY